MRLRSDEFGAQWATVPIDGASAVRCLGADEKAGQALCIVYIDNKAVTQGTRFS